MFKINNKDTRTKSLTSPVVFIVNLSHISHLFVVFLFDSEHSIVYWVIHQLTLDIKRLREITKSYSHNDKNDSTTCRQLTEENKLDTKKVR